MSNLRRTTAILVSVLMLAFTSFVAHAAGLPARPAAQLPTWTPVDVTVTALDPTPTSEEPSETPTSSSTFTPSPTSEPPSATPSPTTEPPTHTPTPTPTHTSTTEAPPATTNPSATPRPTNTSRPADPGPPAPNPACQSMVEGHILDSAGQRVIGATVTIDGPDWSRRIMTDDDGRYGFAGLCAGQATLQAFLASGQSGPIVIVTLTGSNSLRQDLRFATSSAAPTQATQASQATAQPTPTGTAEAGMPVTGYAGWLLAGGAALGALLLVSAGGRRVLQAYERARSRQ